MRQPSPISPVESHLSQEQWLVAVCQHAHRIFIIFNVWDVVSPILMMAMYPRPSLLPYFACQPFSWFGVALTLGRGGGGDALVSSQLEEVVVTYWHHRDGKWWW